MMSAAPGRSRGRAPALTGARETGRWSGPKAVKPEFVFHYDLGLSLERSGKYEQAVQAYHEAIRAQPLDVDAQVHLGLILRELGRDEEANRGDTFPGIFLWILDPRIRTKPYGRLFLASLPPCRRPGDLPVESSS